MNQKLALVTSLVLLLLLGGCANLKTAAKSSSSLTSLLGFSELPDWYITSRYSYPDSFWITNDFGMNIHYRDVGDGPTVVLIHGEMDSLHSWEEWIATLSTNFRVVAIDLPGSGLSGATHCVEYVKETCTENLSADYIKHTLEYFIEDLDLKDINLVGSSYGGYLAIDYTLKHPDKVEKLVLLSPSGFQQSPPDSLEWLTGTSFISKHYQPSVLVTNVISDFFASDKTNPASMKRFLHLAQSEGMHTSNIYKLAMTEEIMLHGSTLDFSQLEKETLLLWGEKDKWSDPDLASKWDETLPNSTLVTYPQLGHVLMMEQPDITVADVSAYFLGDPLPSIEGLGIEGSFTIDEAAGAMDREQLFGSDEDQAEEMTDVP